MQVPLPLPLHLRNIWVEEVDHRHLQEAHHHHIMVEGEEAFIMMALLTQAMDLPDLPMVLLMDHHLEILMGHLHHPHHTMAEVLHHQTCDTGESWRKCSMVND